jgi:hypothetical protein
VRIVQDLPVGGEERNAANASRGDEETIRRIAVERLWQFIGLHGDTGA